MPTPLIIERHKLVGISPQVANATLTLANTEYSVAIPEGTRQFCFKARNLDNIVKFSFEDGASGTTYATLDGFAYYEDSVLAQSIVIYMQSPTAGCVVEFTLWS
jgi:hypothetical protein